MLRRVFHVHDSLIPEERKGWLVFAALGSFAIALMDMAGIAVTLPLMLVATGAPGATTVLEAFERFGVSSTSATIISLAAIVGCLFILKSMVAMFIRYWQLGRQNTLLAKAATGLLARYSASPYEVHRTRETADIQRQVNFSLAQIFNGVLGGLLTLSVDGLTLALTVIVLTVVSPVGMLTAAVVFGGCIVGVQLFTRRRAKEIGLKLSDQSLIAWSALLPLLEGFREVRLTQSRESFLRRYSESRAETAKASRNLAILSELPKHALDISLILGIGSIAIVISAFGDPETTVAILGVFAAAAARMTPTLNRLAFTLVQVKSASASLESIEAILPTLPTALDIPDIQDNGDDIAGDIQLTNVGYKYPDADHWSVRNVSCTIPFGTSAAFVGASGAGKSTLLDLILGLFTPREGTVTSNRFSVHDNPQRWLRTIGVVSQDVYLFNGTVRENVAFGAPEAGIDDDRVQRAVSDAQLDDLLAELPDGLHTKLGERGVRISGGQRQRIGIARALYRNPSVLILDEATSALDNLTEHKITRTLEKLAGEITIIIVAHRLSTIRNVDTVIYLEDGTVSAKGTFNDVTDSNANFRELVELGRLH